VDFTREATELVQQFGSRAVIVAQTLDEARLRVTELSKIPAVSAAPPIYTDKPSLRGLGRMLV
jgi:hypothetical protein